MIKEALSKLNKKQMDYCIMMSIVIAHDVEAGSQFQSDKDHGRLRGYLECLEDMGVITGYEMRGLYLWFCEKNRTSKSTYVRTQYDFKDSYIYEYKHKTPKDNVYGNAIHATITS